MEARLRALTAQSGQVSADIQIFLPVYEHFADFLKLRQFRDVKAFFFLSVSLNDRQKWFFRLYKIVSLLVSCFCFF